MLITARFLGCLVSRTTRTRPLCCTKVTALKLRTELEETVETEAECAGIKDMLKLEKLKLVILIEKPRMLKLEMLMAKLKMLIKKLEMLKLKTLIKMLKLLVEMQIIVVMLVKIVKKQVKQC